MQTSDFNYDLPQSQIAQTPIEPRDQSKLLVLNREDDSISHRTFTDILDYFNAGDVLVANSSRVLPARLYGRKPTGGKAELLLLKRLASDASWVAMIGAKKMRAGSEIIIHDVADQPTNVVATVENVIGNGQFEVRFNQDNLSWLYELGHTPLPPYIHEQLDEKERYQTIYARQEGSAAAPTAGLHFTPDLLLALRAKGVLFETVTLHVGLDTFKPVSVESVAEHKMHSEWIEVTADTAQVINNAKLAGKKVVAVGTTTARTLESASWRAAGVMDSLQHVSDPNFEAAACGWKPMIAYSGTTDLFIHPPYQFRIVDTLITNFHMPQSTLLMMVSAFSSREMLFGAYKTAVTENYRFLSFGDAMLII